MLRQLHPPFVNLRIERYGLEPTTYVIQIVMSASVARLPPHQIFTVVSEKRKLDLARKTYREFRMHADENRLSGVLPTLISMVGGPPVQNL